MIRNGFPLMLLMILLGCIEPFNPTISIEGEANRLVVDGRITDQNGPYTVRLSHSKAISSDLPTLVETGAIVIIEEENGPLVTLVENQPGIYLTNPADLKGEVGKRYRLSIRLSDESEYQSSWELMRETPEIDKLLIEFQSKETRERGDIVGVQLHVDTQGDPNQAAFFRWEMIETWKYEAPLFSDSIYLGYGVTALKPPEDYHKICWKNTKKDIMITSVENLSDRVALHHKLSFISSDSARFNIRYSALIKQYVLGIEEFEFWKNLENTNENIGTLFDKQPFQVTGNVKNRINKDEIVLGYFSANSEKKTRIYIDREDFPRGFLPDPEFSDCVIYNHNAINEESFLDLIRFGARIFYKLPRFASNRVCGDCEVYGGSATQPEFWEE